LTTAPFPRPNQHSPAHNAPPQAYQLRDYTRTHRVRQRQRRPPPPSPKPKALPPQEPDPPAPEQEAAEPAKPANKPYKFSQARKDAFEKGRAKRAENLKARQEEKAKVFHGAKKKKEKALADKITKELEEIQLDEGKVMKQVKRRMKKKKAHVVEEESESDSSDSSSEEEQVVVRKKKPRKKVRQKRVPKKVIIYESEEETDDMGQVQQIDKMSSYFY
jgi:hypothetical protein